MPQCVFNMVCRRACRLRNISCGNFSLKQPYISAMYTGSFPRKQQMKGIDRHHSSFRFRIMRILLRHGKSSEYLEVQYNHDLNVVTRKGSFRHMRQGSLRSAYACAHSDQSFPPAHIQSVNTGISKQFKAKTGL